MRNTDKEPPNHNTLTCYVDYRCRLPECVKRYNDRNNERRRARAAGTYNVFIDAEPVRRHILKLQRQGMSCTAIGVACGLTTQTILEFVRPLQSRGRGRRQRTTPATAQKILAVTLANRTTGRIDSTGTRRRVQALAALGWPTRHVALHAGFNTANSHDLLQRTVVFAATARAVADAYDELRTARPLRKGVTKAHMQRAKNLASRNGWPPPKYWDQHPGAIDDPEFEPEYGKTRAEIIVEEVEWLTANGLDLDQAANSLNITRRHIERAFTETRAKAVAA